MKHLKLFAALCCAAALCAACDQKDEITQEEIQKHDVSLYFYLTYYDEITPEKVSKNLSDPAVENVYLEVMDEDFTGSGPIYITALRNKILQPAINVDSIRVFGRGNFVIRSGQMLETDSLWLVSKGWTISNAER